MFKNAFIEAMPKIHLTFFINTSTTKEIDAYACKFKRLHDGNRSGSIHYASLEADLKYIDISMPFDAIPKPLGYDAESSTVKSWKLMG